MKLLFYFGGFSPVGGIETFSRNLLQDQVQRGHKCSLLCWGYESEILKQMRERNIRVIRKGWRWGCRLNLPDLLMLPSGIKEIACADLVLFGKLLPKQQLGILRRLAGEKPPFVFITPYRPDVGIDLDAYSDVKEHLEYFDEIWVQDKQFESDIRMLGFTKRVVVIPYMPEPIIPPSIFNAKPYRIGFLGRLVDDKNLPLLLESFQLLMNLRLADTSTSRQNYRLDIYGDGPLREYLEDLVFKLEISPYVYFHGVIPQSEVHAEVSACHLFVFTSHAEGQCLAALEILSAGRPIVATDAGAFPDILNDSRLGELVLEKTPRAVASAILRVCDAVASGEIRPEIVQTGFSERFGAEKVGNKYSTVIGSLVPTS